MQNFEHAVEATNTAINSAGSAARENSAYMESLEAKTNRVAATFQELSNVVVDSGLVKGFLDIANVFLELMKLGDGLIPKFALLTGTLTGGITIWSMVGGKITGLAKGISEYAKVAVSAARESKDLGAGLAAAGKVAGGFNKAILAASGGIGIALIAVEAAIAIYDHFTVSLEEQIEKVNTLQNDLDGLKSEYDELASKDNLTEADERRLQVLEAQIKANNILLDQEARKQYEMQYQTKETLSELQDRGFEGLSFGDVVDATGETAYKASVEQLEKYIQELEDLDTKIIELDETSDTYTDDLEKLVEEKESLQEKANDLTEVLTNETNTLEELRSKMAGGLNPTLEDSMELFGELMGSSGEAGNSLVSLENQLRQISNVELKPKDADSMQEWLEGLTGIELDQLTSLLELAGDKAWYLSGILGSMEGADAIAFITEAYKEYYGIIDDAAEATNKFQQALEKDYAEPARNMWQAADYIQQSQQQGIQNIEAYNAALEMFYGTTNQKLIDSLQASGVTLDNYFAYFRDGAFDAGLLFDRLTELNGSFVNLTGSLEEGNLQITINDFKGLAEQLGLTETGLKSLIDSSGQFGIFDYQTIDAETRALRDIKENLKGASEEFRNLQTVMSDGQIRVEIESSNINEAKEALGKIQDELNLISDLTGVELSFDFEGMSADELEDTANQLYSFYEKLQSFVTDEGHWDFSGLVEGLENATDIEISGDKITFKTDAAAEEFKNALLGDLEGTEMGNAISANIVDNMTFDTAALGEKGKEAIDIILNGAAASASTSQIQLSGIFDGLISEMGVADDVANTLAQQGTKIKESFNKISNQKVNSLGDSLSDASSQANKLLTKAQQIRSTLSTPINVKITATGMGNLERYSATNDVNRAGGKLGGSDSFLRFPNRKRALTGEEGPEYRISSSGEVDVLGENGPEIATINKGDTIIPADVTAMIRKGQLGAFAGGYGGTTSVTGSIATKPGLVSLGEVSSAYSGATTSSVSSSASSVSLSMNKVASSTKKAAQETEKLTSGIESQIEAFEEQNSLLEDNIYFREKQGASFTELIELNRQYQNQLHEQANLLRSQGLDDSAEEIREIQKQWWSVEDDITSLQEEAFDERLKQSEDYIERRNELMDWGADSEIKAWKRVMNWMDEWYAQGLVSYEYYLEQRWEAEQKYRDAIKADMEEEQEAYETLFSLVADKAQEEIDKLQEQRDEVEEYWQNKIDALEKANEELEEQIEKEEALDALARARQTKVMVYKDGRFQYINDIDEVSEAQANLEKIERDEALREEVENLEKLRDQALKNIDDQIEAWEDYKEEWASVVDDYQRKQDELLVEQRLGIKLEGENWKERLDNLESYVEEYEELMARLAAAQYEEYYEEEQPSGGGGSSSGPDFGNIGSIAGSIIGSVAGGVGGGAIGGTIGGIIGGVIDKVTGGSSSKKSSSSSNKGSSSSSGFRYAVTSSGNAPEKAKVGDVIETAGGNYKIVTSDTPGAAYNPSSGRWSVKVPSYASGTLNAPKALSLVGEEGPELRLLNRGDGIIPSDVTQNLWAWGMSTPSDLMKTITGQIANNGQTINIAIQEFKPNLPNVKNGEDFANYLKNNFWRDTMQFVSS